MNMKRLKFWFTRVLNSFHSLQEFQLLKSLIISERIVFLTTDNTARQENVITLSEQRNGKKMIGGGVIKLSVVITSSLGPKMVPFNCRPHRLRTTGYSGRTEKQKQLGRRSHFM